MITLTQTPSSIDDYISMLPNLLPARKYMYICFNERKSNLFWQSHMKIKPQFFFKIHIKRVFFIVKTTLKIKKMFVWLCISMMKEKLNGWITQWCTLIKFHFYLIKTPQRIYLLFQNKLELWVGFFFLQIPTPNCQVL